MSDSEFTFSLISYIEQCEAKRSLHDALKAYNVKVLDELFGCLPSVGDRVVYRRIEKNVTYYIVGTVSKITEHNGQVTVLHYGGLPSQGNETNPEWSIVTDI